MVQAPDPDLVDLSAAITAAAVLRDSHLLVTRYGIGGVEQGRLLVNLILKYGLKHKVSLHRLDLCLLVLDVI